MILMVVSFSGNWSGFCSTWSRQPTSAFEFLSDVAAAWASIVSRIFPVFGRLPLARALTRANGECVSAAQRQTDQRFRRLCARSEDTVRQRRAFRRARELQRADQYGVETDRRTFAIQHVLRERRRQLAHGILKVFAANGARFGRLACEFRQERGQRAACTRVVAMLRREISRDHRF